MIHISYWYGFVRNMLSFITKSVMILLYHLPRLVAAGGCHRDWPTSHLLLPPPPPTQHNTHLHQHSTTHIYTNTTTKYHISDTYKIINICYEIVHSITNVYYMFYFHAINESMTSSTGRITAQANTSAKETQLNHMININLHTLHI